MSNGDGTTMTVPLKRPLVMPQTGRRAPHVPQKLQKPKVIPTSKNLLAWLDRK
jgi:hypothetical protein